MVTMMMSSTKQDNNTGSDNSSTTGTSEEPKQSSPPHDDDDDTKARTKKKKEPRFWQRLRNRFKARRKQSAQWRDFEGLLRSESVQQKIHMMGEEDASQRSRIAQQRPEEFAETLVQELAKGADLWKVIGMLHFCRSDALNYALQSPPLRGSTSPQPLIMQLFRRMHHPEHRMALLAILSRLRLHELSLESKAVLLKTIQEERSRLKMSIATMRAVASIWTSTKNPELILLKEAIQHGGGFADLHDMLFQKVNEDLRIEILQHFSAEAMHQRLSKEPNSHNVKTDRLCRRIHIITDVDDTILPNWLDKRLPRGTIYPGALQFYKELRASQELYKDAEQITTAKVVNSSRSTASQAESVGDDGLAIDITSHGWWKRFLRNSEAMFNEMHPEGHSISSDQYIQDYPQEEEDENSLGIASDSPEDENEYSHTSEEAAEGSGTTVEEPLEELLASSIAAHNLELPHVHSRPATSSAEISPGGLENPPWYLRWRPRAEVRVPNLEQHMFSNEQECQYDSQTVGNLFVVTARPPGVSGLIKSHTIRKLESIGFGNVSVFSGSLRTTAGGIESMGQRKLENLQRLIAMFPEYKFIFLGDSGQADAAVAAVSQTYYCDKVVAALIHNVNPSSDTTGDGGSKESYADGNVLFYNNYVQAAMLAKQRGLISQVAVHRVANAAIQDLEYLRSQLETKSTKWHTRYHAVVEDVITIIQSIKKDDNS